MDKDKIKLNTNIRDILASKTEADELNDLTNMQKRNINEITVMPEVTLATSLRNQNLPVKPCSDNISLPRKGCTSLDVVPLAFFFIFNVSANILALYFVGIVSRISLNFNNLAANCSAVISSNPSISSIILLNVENGKYDFNMIGIWTDFKNFGKMGK